MDKFSKIIEKYLLPISDALGTNPYIQAVSAGIMTALPVTIVGSIFTLFANLPYKPYMDFITKIGIAKTLAIPGEATIELMAIFTVFFTAYYFVKEQEIDPVPAGLLSLTSFIMLTPHYITIGEKSVKGIAYGYLGPTSLFVALVVGLVVGKLYTVIVKKGLVINMPEGVPPMVARTFQPIIAAFIIITIVLLISAAFSVTSYQDVHAFISKMVQQPMVNLGSSLPFFIILYTLMNLCWFFGIHGSAVWAPAAPIVTAINMANLTAFQAGDALPNMYANWVMYLKIGGLGSTLGLCFYMAFFARSERYKKLGRISLLPSFFNINEPLCFGLPLVLNPLMFIPLVLNPLICGLIAYVGLNSGLVNYGRGLQLPWTTPAIITPFLEGGISSAVLQLICLSVVTLMYIPFFRTLDKKETATENEETSSS